MRNIPVVTKNLLIVNIICFLAMMVLKGAFSVGGSTVDLNDIFGLHFFMASDFHIYQLFTYMFMHANLQHIFFNMFALWMFGCVVENVWGPRKFLLYYIVCGVGAGLFQEAAQFFAVYADLYSQVPISMGKSLQVMHQLASQLNGLTTIGASGAIYAVLLAFGMIFPEERIFLFPLPIPIKAKWFVIGYVAIELFSALATPGDSVAHFAHLGGMVIGFFLIRYWNKHPSAGYGIADGRQFFDGLRSSWERRSHRQSNPRQERTERADHVDWDYNARKKARQDEIDRILDKVRRSGYDSLSREEKQTLFDSSNDK